MAVLPGVADDGNASKNVQNQEGSTDHHHHQMVNNVLIRVYSGNQKQDSASCFKSFRKNSSRRKNPNPRSTYPYFYHPSRNGGVDLRDGPIFIQVKEKKIVKRPRSDRVRVRRTFVSAATVTSTGHDHPEEAKRSRKRKRVNHDFDYGYVKNNLIKKTDEKSQQVIKKIKVTFKLVNQEEKKRKAPAAPTGCDQNVIVPDMPLATVDELKEFITNQLNGSELTLMIRKSLFATDIAKHNNRFSMPASQTNIDFLTEGEKQILGAADKIVVPLIGPNLVEFNEEVIHLRYWGSNRQYVLKNGWNKFVKQNRKHLKAETMVEVWAFRRGDDQLCLAIACV